MAKADNLIRIVLVEDAVEEAEQAISVLRNAGIAVRPTRAIDPEQLKVALDAPTLVAWHGMPAAKALFFSLFACLMNCPIRCSRRSCGAISPRCRKSSA